MTVKAEITFMVYGQNNVGMPERRNVEISQQDFGACNSSNRNNNEQLLSWAKNLFPSAKKVLITSATRI